MTSRCSGDSWARHARISSVVLFFSRTRSGPSAGSATVDAMWSSNSTDGDAVTREQRLHRQSIACRDSLDQLLIRRSFPECRLTARCGSHIKVGCRHGYTPAFTSRPRTRVQRRCSRIFPTDFSSSSCGILATAVKADANDPSSSLQTGALRPLL